MSYLSQLDDLDDELNGYDDEEDEEDVEEAAAATEVREGQRRGRGDSSGRGDREDMEIEQLPGRNSFPAVSAVSAIEVHLEAMVVEEVPRGGSHGGMGDVNGVTRPLSPTRLPRKGGGGGVGEGGEGARVPSPSRRRSPPRQNTAAEDDLRRYSKRTLRIPIGINWYRYMRSVLYDWLYV